MIIQSPIVVLVGDKGSGKTLFLTYVASYHHQQGFHIYSNYNLTKIPYTKFTYEDLLNVDELTPNSVILMDEGQMGADAYDVFSKKAKMITQLSTQLRKKNLHLYISTQRFTFIAKRLRDLTDITMAFQNIRDAKGQIIQGTAKIEVYKRDIISDYPDKVFVFDGRKFFGHYDSSEIIE